ncbi:unnamed protein product [Lota lota]
MVENRSWVLREGVYRWFSSLTSARRTEFLCGLLDLCVPIELRFLGSCLEDLARKDYNSLRDAEIKANNPTDLSSLTNITDEVVRSKLLVSLALLSSDNRQAAGVLYRTLTHIDTVINNYGLPLNDGQTEEQFLLLFTMASNHPAFSFHQKQLLRQELRQIQDILQILSWTAVCICNTIPNYPTSYLMVTPHTVAVSDTGTHTHNHRHTQTQGMKYRGQFVVPMTSSASLLTVVIERVEVRSVTRTADDHGEYTFEAHWLDGCVSSVVRTQQEVTVLLSQLADAFPEEGLDKLAHPPLEPDPSSFMTRSLPQLSPLPPSAPPSVPLEQHSPQMLPPAVPLQCASSSSSSQASMGSSIIDSIVPHSSHSFGHTPQSHAQHSPTPGAQFISLSHCQLGSPLPHPTVSQAQAPVHSSQGLVVASAPPEPNGILDWLRRLRLHKYYPVFKQLTMEEFLALTEEDLNKYDLTQGAKKKLKTQLELQNREMKLEKRYAAPQFPGSCGGIAMVTPSSHMRPSLHPTSTGELRVEVEAGAHHQGVPVPRDRSSSSGYSSSLGSPRSPLRRSTAFDRTKEVHRRKSLSLGSGPEKDRACVLLLGSSSGRPTAQVLPVQTDLPPPLPTPLAASSSSSSPCHPVFSLGSLHPHHPSYPHTLLATAPHPPHILTSPRKLRPLPMGPDDRTKVPGLAPPGSGVGPGMGLRLDGLFPAGHTADGLQESVVCRGLMVDTSSALTSTSNSLHHVSHPPVHFHLSSAPAPSAYYSYPAGASSFSSIFSSSCFAPYSSSASSSKPGSLAAACSSGGGGAGYVPMATENNTVPVPGSYCSPSALISSPSPSPPSSSSSSSCSSSLDCPGGANNGGHTPSACPCSSCGCHGSCGVFGALPGYAAAGYLRPFSAAGGPSLFTLGPVLHFSPLIASSSSSSSSSASGGGPFSYPLVAPQALYRHGIMSHDLQKHQPQHGCGVYMTQETLRNGGAKRAASNVSCYNCGVGGHRAEDCKQPPMDAQQGTFRLKYIPRPDIQDSGE